MAVVWLLLFLLFQLSNAHPVSSEENQDDYPNKFQLVYQWHTVNFTWPSHRHYKSVLHQRLYIPENVFISNVKIFNDTMYLAMPRLKLGVPATLGQLPLEPEVITDSLVTPFPNWEMNTLGKCSCFQSVHSFEIDLDGVMWVIDNGRPSISYIRNRNGRICLPSLVLVDLKNDSVILERYVFPNTIVGADSYLKDIVIDDVDGGYAYIIDNSKTNPGIVVYSRRENSAWKFSDSRSMKADANENQHPGDMDISGNINGIALGPRYTKENEVIERYVFFSSLFSFKLYAMHASWLRNRSISNSFSMMTRNIIEMGSKSSYSDGMIMDEKGILYYGLLQDHSIASWDSFTVNFSIGHSILAHDTKHITWVERFAFDEANNLYVLLTRFTKFAMKVTNPKKVNYKIERINVGANSYLQPSENVTEPEPSPPGGSNSIKAVRVILMFLLFIITSMNEYIFNVFH
ncbi:protein yellow-like [Arctopsyche grandis]|uniref:protein yellow-like n=1 Tax=Arctopsyche grandis TaxID=121162 RepID=UPI00406D7365